MLEAGIDAAQACAQHQRGHVDAFAGAHGAHTAFVTVLLVAVAQGTATGQDPQLKRGHLAEWLAALGRIEPGHPDAHILAIAPKSEGVAIRVAVRSAGLVGHGQAWPKHGQKTSQARQGQDQRTGCHAISLPFK